MKNYLIICGLLLLHLAGFSQNAQSWSLQDCLDYAVANNITVKKAALDQQTAAINYQQQKDNKLPSVTGNASLSGARGSTIDPITSNFVDQTIVSNSYGITGQLILYQGNKLNLQIEKNELLVQQSDLYQKEAENNIRLSVIEAYLQAVYYQEGISIAKNAAASSKEELQQGEIKYKNGAIAQKDLADLQTQHAANEYSIVAAENLYAQQVLQLKQMLELEPGVSFSIRTEGLEREASLIPDKETVFAAAAHQLPDIKIYDAQAAVLNKEMEIVKSSYKPTLSLNAGINTGFTNTMDYVFFTQLYRNFSQTAGLSLNIPIFSKKENKSNLALAKINLQQNELDKAAASKELYAKIENAWQQAVANQAQQASAKVARDNARLAYDLARKKYDFGGLTTTELSVSRNSYLSAEQTYLQTKYLAVLYDSLLNFYQGNKIS